ncbi:hypothetical protein DFR70_104469 [Nocardia tenerifensis]|uniref:Uncharacterized protein n=1 Tax=Nocardia tenerifensis TaxID=228006 RepID=A0A318K844_9NOCA|nr:hypothetical protein [Nocardia tenerifensis]PXX65405.1 hypothetical protein DFR70_104469 [Nocardia tenerifensis]
MDKTVLAMLELADHATPAAPLTIDHAHESMQVHRACSTDHCRRKALAFNTLIAAGRIVPDSSRVRE